MVYDVFAGVGPFSIPAAKSKKNITVLANDLNPESYKWLNHNAKLNKIKSGLSTYNLDGRDFIKDVARKDLLSRWQNPNPDEPEHAENIRFVMNLPALAIEFLDVFPGLFKDIDPESLTHLVLPKVYCYCFSKSEDPMQDARERVENVIGSKLAPDHDVRIVRNVAPNKEMLCVIFTLQIDVLFNSKELGEGSEPPDKKLKADSN